MNEQLNSAQLQAVRAAADRQVMQYIEQLQLRKWAVEQAFKVVGTPDELTKLVTAIYYFVADAQRVDPPGVLIGPDKP